MMVMKGSHYAGAVIGYPARFTIVPYTIGAFGITTDNKSF